MSIYSKYILPRIINFAMTRRELEKQRPDMAVEAAGIALEIGFGPGLNLPYYKNITKLYALDPSRELWELAQERINKVSFPIEYLQVSAEKIPLADNSADSLVSTWSLCSIPRPDVALKEMFRVLKPGGKFIFIEHGKSPNNFIAKLQKLFTIVSKRVAGGCHMDREIDKLIGEAGFKVQKIEEFQQQSRPLGFMYNMYKGVSVKI